MYVRDLGLCVRDGSRLTVESRDLDVSVTGVAKPLRYMSYYLNPPVYPLITPIVVPYIIPYITPLKEFRLWLIYRWKG